MLSIDQEMLMSLTRRGLAACLATLVPVAAAFAATKSDPQLDQSAEAALQRLIAGNTAARLLYEQAVAVLVFPKIVKAGFVVGGAYGKGALQQSDRSLGYYNSAAASYGLQAGVQWFGYAMFFMNDSALNYLDSSQGFEIGVGPSVVVVDEGIGKKLSSTTLTQDVYAFIFGQKGLMAGIGIEGSKITKI
jgi:lipid-binding SYLF domain-containing protein